MQSDVTARAYVRGFDDHFRGAGRGAGRDDAASRRLGVDYVREVTAIGEDQQAALRYGPRAGSARAAERSPHAAAGDRDWDTMPSR